MQKDQLLTPAEGLAGKRVLFIHQNFPAQFTHLAPALLALGCDVKALAIGGRGLSGIDLRRYAVTENARLSGQDVVADVEVKARRATACATAMRKLASEGFTPDLIIAHPGWGESLFCKDVWPHAKLVAYGEFYYQPVGADHAFDPEFSHDTVDSRMRLRMRNTGLLHAYVAADAILCPTAWQKACIPVDLQHKCVVIFDGIDTQLVKPNPQATIGLGRSGLVLGRQDSVLTFVNRNLEPHRGFHVFMRALPDIMARNPATRCVIVGEDSVSYGAAPKNFRTWREAMLHEVGSRLPMDRIHFVGRVAYADYVRLLQVSTCHVYMTYPFVLSWSCIEALAAGCRVVASDTPPVHDAVVHGVNGQLFDFFDTGALADAVGSVLRSPGRYDSMASEAVVQARRRFDLNTVSRPLQLEWLSTLICS